MGTTPPAASTSRLWHRGILAFGFLVVASFYAWTNDPTGSAWRVGAPQSDYYNLLMHGFLKGHLYMDVPVSEELKASPDPWDPAVRGPHCPILQDATYYNGHFYLYYGVAPLVTLMFPFRLITGADMPLPLAALCFAWAGLLTALVLWASIRERYFPETRAWVSLAAVLVIGMASPLPVILRRTLVYELPILSGFFFSMVALLALYRSVHSDRSRVGWLSLASVALGLAVASRLTFLFVMPILLVPVWLAWRERRCAENSAAPLRVLAAAVGPIAAVGLLMGLYNYLRFGQFTEFGTRYQVAEVWNLAKMVKFSGTHVAFNLTNYFAAPPDLSRYFPFFLIPGTWPWSIRPAPDYWGSELVPGMLICFPICWLAALSLFARPRPDAGRNLLRVWLLCAWGLLIGNGVCLLFFHAGMIRYMVDFTPSLMLCAAVGLLVLERWLARSHTVIKAAGRVAWLALLVGAVAFAIMLSFELHGTFRAIHPITHARVAKFFESVSFWNPRLPRHSTGPVEIALQVEDKFAVGRSEPLLTTGAGSASEHVFLRRVDEGHLIVGYRRGVNAEAQLSLPIATKAGGVHRIYLDLGSLYAASQPERDAGAGAPAALLEKLRKRWMILVDDAVVLQGRYPDDVTSPAGDLVFVGYNPNSDEFGKVRLNPIVSARRLSSDEVATRAANQSSLSVEFKVPRDGAQGSQALLAIEGPGADFQVEIEYLPAARAALSFWSSGRELGRDEPFTIDNQWHRLDIEQVPVGRENTFHVRIDGKPIVAVPTGAVDLRRDAFKAGWGAATKPNFTGLIRNAASDSVQPVKLAPRGNRTALALKFPRQPKGVSEPLLVTGRNGSGDLYEVVYLEQDQVCFKHDHWGDGIVRTSPPIKINPEGVHRLLFEFTPLPGTSASPGAAREGVVHLEIDGVRVWEDDVRCHAFKDTEVYVGVNEIGGSTCDREFSGEILAHDPDAAVTAP